MSVNFRADGDFEAILDYLLSAESEQVDSVSAGETMLRITADSNTNMKTFKQAVRLAVENAPDEPHVVEFDQETAYVTLDN